MQILLLMTSIMNEAFCTWFLHMLHRDYEIDINHEDLGDNRSHGWLLDTYWLLKKLFWDDNSSRQEYHDVANILKTWVLMWLCYNCWMTLEDTTTLYYLSSLIYCWYKSMVFSHAMWCLTTVSYVMMIPTYVSSKGKWKFHLDEDKRLSW